MPQIRAEMSLSKQFYYGPSFMDKKSPLKGKIKPKANSFTKNFKMYIGGVPPPKLTEAKRTQKNRPRKILIGSYNAHLR
jgi:hypothetical protein